ncbi:MAG: [FeFe] hydrogenase H-cluster maturation GTPase HydF [Candidatus Aminicenantes bacterium]|nr:[FeFe] hydrogenase H-cluster maturation GTPase HydF [Candidatus Aminicenantes bacterium]
MAERAMRGDRLHIAIFGRRNAGKSSLINAMTGQPVAIVSDVPGTTTDPVFKSLEFQPIGPVVLIDTAGIDDRAEGLGAERVKKAAAVLEKSDLALLVVDVSSSDFAFEDELLEKFRSRAIPAIVVANKTDLPQQESSWFRDKLCVRVSALSGQGMEELRRRILEIAPSQWEPSFLRDLVRKEETVVLVVPIDTGAPKGRLIMPQVKALRDALDAGAMPFSCRESELKAALGSLKQKPALVVTDSQAFTLVASVVPDDVLLTSFSILSARQKGDLPGLVEGVLAVPSLRPGDRVLIAESCSHHPLQDDIGRIKLPRWLNEYVGGGLKIDVVPGSGYPEDLSSYRLVVHCGACTLNRREMLRRQELPAAAGVPMTNYGVLISFLKNVFPRALRPFPELFARYEHVSWPRRQGMGGV